MKISDKFMKQPELGKKIFELRQNKGLTQSELAEKCNLSLRTVQRIESTEVMPRNYTIKLIFSNLDYESATLNFGILLDGTGKVWLDGISFEVVNKMETETTGNKSYVNNKPTNLDFSK